MSTEGRCAAPDIRLGADASSCETGVGVGGCGILPRPSCSLVRNQPILNGSIPSAEAGQGCESLPPPSTDASKPHDERRRRPATQSSRIASGVATSIEAVVAAALIAAPLAARRKALEDHTNALRLLHQHVGLRHSLHQGAESRTPWRCARMASTQQGEPAGLWTRTLSHSWIWRSSSAACAESLMLKLPSAETQEPPQDHCSHR